MDVATSYVKTHHPHIPHVIMTDAQTAGRGKPGRVWDSPAGNLYMTIAFPVMETGKEEMLARHVPFVVIVALGAALHSLGLPQDALLYKWPNDLLLGNKKLGGVLIEPLTELNQLYFLIGIGLNVISAPRDVPATCLEKEGYFVTAEEAMKEFMPYFFDYYEKYRHSGFDFIKKLWTRHSFKLNEFMHFRGPNTEYKGVFRGITDEGALILDIESGRETLLYSGDVV